MVATRRSQRLASAPSDASSSVPSVSAGKTDEATPTSGRPLRPRNQTASGVAEVTPEKPAGSKRKAAAVAAAAASATGKTKKSKTSKAKLTGLAKAITDPTDALGVVDPESKIENGWICSIRDENGVDAPADVMLALVDPAKHNDKYYVLQLIEVAPEAEEDDDDNDDQKENRKQKAAQVTGPAPTYVVYTRWGRTGTSGQALKEEFPAGDWDGACAKFEHIFHSKTGHAWQDRDEPTVGDKYRVVNQNFADKRGGYSDAKWQYYVDDGVDGKATGWYDYDDSGSKQVERLYSEFTNTADQGSGGKSGGNRYFATRMVASGAYTYSVDLLKMTQTNSTHPNHKSRRIRRCPRDVDAPGATAATVKAPPAASLPSSKTKSGSHPVDVSISVIGKDPSEYKVVQSNDGQWYDAVLNQCNIGNNNNKYYRLQMLQHSSTGQFYVWMRWGRVGEPARSTASKFMGPYKSAGAGAEKEFRKKYKDKTKNAFGTDNFVSYTGKYTPIEIDNDVEVTDDMKAQVDTTNVKVEYAPSELDGKTKELIQTLFSKDTQNEALVSFNLDLKRLPLGVPSKAQIQSGVDILSQIEDKLNGDSSVAGGSSFQELSSRFYTAIPHSFGRQRPPIIQDKESLQSRFDMCNILLDMYDTNQTMRRIESEQKKQVDGDGPSTKQIPNPVDQHYKSLRADLTLVDPSSEEFKAIKRYFDATKHQGSASQLIDAWSVDRHNEADRFKKYDAIGNRHLLWHGTNIAVVAPILTSGLRIMPHSGGRVGAGIYLANLQQKSAQYTCAYGARYACMLLCEAPLGKQHEVTNDGPHASGLRAAPTGFDSVRAVGRYQPKKFVTTSIDGKDVSMPTAPPVDAHVQSTFAHDELLVYDESQVRLRYVVTVRM